LRRRVALALLLVLAAAPAVAVFAEPVAPPPTGPPAAPGAAPPMPPPETGQEYPLVVDALWWRYLPDTGALVARGGVSVTFRGYTITSDSLDANLEEQRATFSGHVHLVGATEDLHADAVYLNLKTQEWRLEHGSLQTQPEGMVSPLYVRGAEIDGSPKEIVGRELSATTCNLARPHYRIEGRRITIVPDRRLVVDHASLFIGSRRWFTLPRLVVPLRSSSQRGNYNLMPEAGQDNVEGYYLKTSYNYLASRSAIGTLRLDLMSKLGVGLGLDQAYRLASGGGDLVLYGLLNRATGGRDLSATLNHQQSLGSFQALIHSDVRRSGSLYYPGTNTATHQLTLTRNVGRFGTSLGYRLDTSSGSFGSYERTSLNFGQSVSFGRTSARMALGLFDSRSPTLPQKELDTSFDVTSSLKPADISLSYSRKDQLEAPQGGSFFTSLDRLPELALRTDRRRLGGALASLLPGSLGLSYGEYHELPSGVRTSRLLMDLQSDQRAVRLGSTQLSARFGFRQAIYGDDAAQYALSSYLDWATRPTTGTGFDLTYNYLKPKGFTPFRFDQPGEYNTLTAAITHRGRRLNASIGTGIDFRGGPFRYQDAIFHSRFQPGKRLLLVTSAAYDINQGKWRDLINEARVRLGRLNLDLGTRYSPIAGRFGAIRWHIITPLLPKFRLESLGSYNGYTHQFDYRLFRITREHHDWETSLVFADETGYRTERGIRLEFRLKAFPLVDQFAVGQSGQYLDTSVGDVF